MQKTKKLTKTEIFTLIAILTVIVVSVVSMFLNFFKVKTGNSVQFFTLSDLTEVKKHIELKYFSEVQISALITVIITVLTQIFTLSFKFSKDNAHRQTEKVISIILGFLGVVAVIFLIVFANLFCNKYTQTNVVTYTYAVGLWLLIIISLVIVSLNTVRLLKR